MEYGLHEEFPSYAGGLGVLAGDFMKSAGDLGLPVVGVGLRWARGLHRRSASGPTATPCDEWHEHHPTSSPTPARASACASAAARSSAACGAWAATRSRRSSSSSPPTRATAGSPGASTTRGPTAASPRRCCSASAACARCRPCTCRSDLYHFNEGHAVFAGLELIADRMEAGAAFDEALARGPRSRSCSPPTPRCPPATRSTRSPISAASAPTASWSPRELARDRGRPLQHDGGRPAPRPPRQRGGAAARRDRARHVGRTWRTRRRSSPSPTACTWARGRTRACPRRSRATSALRRARREMKDELLAEVERRDRRAPRSRRAAPSASRAAPPPTSGPTSSCATPTRLAPLLEDAPRPAPLRGQGASRRRRGQGGDRAPRGDASASGRTRIVFLENYDMGLGRLLTRGCDVWLNNPRRPAGGERHVGDEGGDERRAQPLGARRLVAGGLRARRDRLGHRATAARAGRPGPPRPRAPSTTRSRARCCRRAPIPARWTRMMRAVDRDGRRALLLGPDGAASTSPGSTRSTSSRR